MTIRFLAAALPGKRLLGRLFMAVRILAFAGSDRKASFNRALLRYAVEGAQQAGAEVTVARLSEYEMPIYDGDLEAERGLPPGALAFQTAVEEHDALLIATPEHNGGYTALLKNSIDWLSRPRPNGQSGVELVAGKTAALISTSPGILGGVRSQTGLRIVLEKLGMIVIPQSIALGGATRVFEDGQLTNPATVDVVRGVGAELARIAERLRSR